jgi:hypothetical protein
VVMAKNHLTMYEEIGVVKAHFGWEER